MKADFVSRRFVCTGSEFFPKHSVSPARDETKFRWRSGLVHPDGLGRSRHMRPWVTTGTWILPRNSELMQKYCILLRFGSMVASSAFLGGLGLFPLGSKNVEKPYVLLLFLHLCDSWCLLSGQCRQWLWCRLWLWLWSSAGRRPVVGRSSAGRQWLVVVWSYGCCMCLLSVLGSAFDQKQKHFSQQRGNIL